MTQKVPDTTLCCKPLSECLSCADLSLRPGIQVAVDLNSQFGGGVRVLGGDVQDGEAGGLEAGGGEGVALLTVFPVMGGVVKFDDQERGEVALGGRIVEALGGLEVEFAIVAAGDHVRCPPGATNRGARGMPTQRSGRRLSSACG